MWPHSQQLPPGPLAFTLDLWAKTTSPRPEGQAYKFSAWRLLLSGSWSPSWFTLLQLPVRWGRVLRASAYPYLRGTRACHPGLLPRPTHGCPTHSPPGHSALSPLFLWVLASFLPSHHLSGTWGGKSRGFHLKQA